MAVGSRDRRGHPLVAEAGCPPIPQAARWCLVMPFAAYVAADAAHGSGVLAVVTIALALSRYGDHESAQTRLVSGTTWEIIELLVTGAAFAFVGLELRAVADQVSGSAGDPHRAGAADHRGRHRGAVPVDLPGRRLSTRRSLRKAARPTPNPSAGAR